MIGIMVVATECAALYGNGGHCHTSLRIALHCGLQYSLYLFFHTYLSGRQDVAADITSGLGTKTAAVLEFRAGMLAVTGIPAYTEARVQR